MVLVTRPVSEVWKYWTSPEHIRYWNMPFDDWHCPEAEVELRVGGRFRYKMEKKDATGGFEHAGIFDQVIPYELIAYTLDDGRATLVEFQQIDHNTIVRERFEPEGKTPFGMQQEFCQTVLNRFKNYVDQQ